MHSPLRPSAYKAVDVANPGGLSLRYKGASGYDHRAVAVKSVNSAPRALFQRDCDL